MALFVFVGLTRGSPAPFLPTRSRSGKDELKRKVKVLEDQAALETEKRVERIESNGEGSCFTLPSSNRRSDRRVRSVPQGVCQHSEIRSDANRKRTRSTQFRLTKSSPSSLHRLDAITSTLDTSELSSGSPQHFERRHSLLNDQFSAGRIKARSNAQGESGSVRSSLKCSASDLFPLAIARIF